MVLIVPVLVALTKDMAFLARGITVPRGVFSGVILSSVMAESVVLPFALGRTRWSITFFVYGSMLKMGANSANIASGKLSSFSSLSYFVSFDSLYFVLSFISGIVLAVLVV